MSADSFDKGFGKFSDTGQWKQIISIGCDHFTAVLKSISDPEENPVVIVNQKWDEEGGSDILGRVESAVYENPRILDDFATRIIISTPKSLWIPSDLTEDDEFDTRLFTSVYPARQEDISSDFDDDEVCAYTLCPGLNAFLRRSIPGCRICCSLSAVKSYFQTEELGRITREGVSSPSYGMYINVHGRFADIFCFRNGRMLTGTMHSWKEPADIAYLATLVSTSYGIDMSALSLFILDEGQKGMEVGRMLRELITSVSIVTPPALTSEFGVPLAAALWALR